MELRDYQLQIATQGRDILHGYGLVYLSMEVRTGKTLTALKCADLFLPELPEDEMWNVLFVTKKKAMGSIESDYRDLSPAYLLDVFNFEALHQVRKQYDLVIVDEAHTCGAFPTVPERVTQLRDICKGLPVIFLSGTPTPESYSQLFHQLSISDRSPWAEHKTFYKWVAAGYVEKKKRYVYNREFVDYSNADQARIKKETDHLFLSYSQAEAGFEQFVKEEVIMVKMKPATYVLAAKIIKDKVYTGKNGELVIADTAVKVQNKVHQIFSGTVICEDKTAIAFDDSKIQKIKELFAGKKIAIFYKFSAEGMMLKSYLKWTESPEEFNERNDLVFIAQVQSGREGINLSTADYLIMYNIDFSALSYWQARARMQTKDRTKESIVVWLFAEGGIEPKIYEAVQQKKDYTLSYFKRDFYGGAGVASSGKDKEVVTEAGVVRA